MTSTIVTALVGLVCTSLSSIVTFLITRRKYNAEASNQEIDNVNDAFKLFREVTNETIRLQNEKLEKLQKENDDLREQIRHLQMQMAQWINAVCYDATCKLRQTDFGTVTAHDLKKK